MSHESFGFSTSLFENRKILVCVGSGGVGKTTTSAALGIAGAAQGKKCLVMTVDPAKRLANALGLEEMLPTPTAIELPDSFPADGSLSAMMLDAKRAFDEVIARHAPDEESRDRILMNPFYQQASASLAGCQEYMAMEELYSLSEESEYDLIVLDTPPSRHALDFLDAPERLRGFFDNKTFSIFMESSSWLGRLGAGVMSRNSPLMLGMSRVMGGDAFLDLLTFFKAFQGMTEGFSARAKSVDQLLRSEDVGFLVVCGPDGSSLHDAEYLLRRIESDHLHLDGLLINRTRERFISPEDLGEMASNTGQTVGDPELVSLALEYHRLVEADEESVERVTRRLAPGTPQMRIPHLNKAIADLPGLREYAERLIPLVFRS